MEVNLSPARIEFVDPTRTISFLGTDMLRAEIGNDPAPPGTTPANFYVRIYLTGDAAATLLSETGFTTYKVDLRPGIITNQPTWENKPDGAQQCLLDIAPIIRAIPVGPLPLVKNSVEYDGGAIQLDGDEAAPDPDHYYGTDSMGNRGYHPLSAGPPVTDVTGTTPISSSGGATPNITHDNSGAAPGTYTNSTVTINATGHVTSASSGTPGVTSVGGTSPINSSGGTSPTISHANSGVTPGVYPNATVTVNASGHVTAASAGSAGGVTSVSASSPIASSGGATPVISHNTSGVVATTYTNATFSVNASGHITGAVNGTASPIYSGALLPFALQTGQGSYELGYVYGLNYINGSMKLDQLYSLAVAQVKFVKLFAWMTSPGFGENDAFVMDLRHVVACWWEALLQGNSNTPLGTARIGSNNEILMPRGDYLVNYPMVFDSGSYIGRGTEPALDGADNTLLAFDRAGWKGTGSDRAILMASTYGNNTPLGYLQGTWIDRFRLAGGMNWSGFSGTDEDIGLLMWDGGENSGIGYIYAEGFHGLGVKIVRGTPTTIENLSLFENGLGGLGLYGNDLSTININTISGDDNPALIRRREGYSRPAGGSLNVNMVKSESGKRDPSRGQIIMDSADSADTTGAYARDTFNNVWYACDFSQTDALWVYRSFTGANARCSVGSFSGYGFSTILQDVTNGRRWANPGSFDTLGFVWNPTNGGTMWSPPPDNITWTPAVMLGTERLGVFYPSGVFNYVALSPTYDYTQGSPSPPADVRTEVFAGAVSDVSGCGQFTVGETGQAYGFSVNQFWQPMAGTPAWSVQPGGTGAATIDPVTGVITATSVGTVNIRCFIVSDFVDLIIEVV